LGLQTLPIRTVHQVVVTNIKLFQDREGLAEDVLIIDCFGLGPDIMSGPRLKTPDKNIWGQVFTGQAFSKETVVYRMPQINTPRLKSGGILLTKNP
jgi:hypothetical protein